MRHHPTLAALAALALGLASTAADAQTAASGERTTYGDSASLSSGAPIVAPDTVDPGQAVSVSVPDAQAGARIELWGPVTQQGRGTQLAAAPLEAGQAVLTAPSVSASYELRYLGANGGQLGRRAFDVAAVPVVLTVPTPVSAGGTLNVQWQGPADPGDRLEVVGPAGAVLESAPVTGTRGAVNTTPIAVPAQPGALQLRYVTSSGAVLRTITFDVAG